MALSSSAIAAKAAYQLQDAGNVRWTPPEISTWINAACREIVMLKPNSLVANVSMKLNPGTKQNLSGAVFVDPSTGLAVVLTPVQLLDVTRNMGSNGTDSSAGNAITHIERKVLDTTLPSWHSIQAGSDVKYFMFDPKIPRTFYVYPQAPTSSLYIEVVVSRLPVNTLADGAVALGRSDIDSGFDAIYENVIVDYVLYRAYGDDAENAAGSQRSQFHYQSFQSALGVKLQNEIAMAPGHQATPQAQG